MLVRITCGVLAVTALTAVPAHAATLTVDSDRAQCPRAQFASIQAAVDNARPGDTVKVCADTYPEQVTVDKPLTLRGPGEADDCSTAPEAIIDPAGEGFSVAVRLAADGITLRGLTIQGTSVGVDTADQHSGYRVTRNLIQNNTLFAIDAGSDGTRASRFDHNCLRGNGYGLVSELDDDTLWPQPAPGSTRAASARQLRNVRVDHNDTTANGSGVEAAGPGQPDEVSFDHNHSHGDGVGIAIQNSKASAISDNEILDAGFPILIGGANTELRISGNLARGQNSAINFQPAFFVDVVNVPSRDTVIKDNDVRASTGGGMSFNPTTLVDSLIKGNTSSGNAFSGIALATGNTGNELRDNQVDSNARSGIMLNAGATGNTLVGNTMHGNGTSNPLTFFDARDNNSPLNTWRDNHCDSDFPAGLICGG